MDRALYERLRVACQAFDQARQSNAVDAFGLVLECGEELYTAAISAMANDPIAAEPETPPVRVLTPEMREQWREYFCERFGSLQAEALETILDDLEADLDDWAICVCDWHVRLAEPHEHQPKHCDTCGEPLVKHPAVYVCCLGDALPATARGPVDFE